jgi:IAA-amino acid hydrolase
MIYVYFVQVVSVTYVKAGKALDATPDVVEFGGTLRSLTTEGLYRLQRRVKEVGKIMYYT